jgi:hypothetical protein
MTPCWNVRDAGTSKQTCALRCAKAQWFAEKINDAKMLFGVNANEVLAIEESND